MNHLMKNLMVSAPKNASSIAGAFCLIGLFCAGCATAPATPTPVAESSPDTSSAPQWPTDAMTLHLASVMSRKSDPTRQFTAHQYCNELNEDFTQCAIFDSDSENARLIGVEYVVSEKLYQRLPVTERRFWHSRNAEILSGQLVAPGMDPEKEHQLLQSQLGTYAKVFYFPFTQSSDLAMASVPMGDPQLAWVFDRPSVDSESQAGQAGQAGTD